MLPLKNNNRLTNCWINKRIARFTSTFPQKKKQRIERNFAGARNPRERSCKEIDKRLSTSSAAPESPIVITWREAESLEELCGMSEAPKLGGNSPGAFGSTSTAEQGGCLSLSALREGGLGGGAIYANRMVTSAKLLRLAKL